MNHLRPPRLLGFQANRCAGVVFPLLSGGANPLALTCLRLFAHKRNDLNRCSRRWVILFSQPLRNNPVDNGIQLVARWFAADTAVSRLLRQGCGQAGQRLFQAGKPVVPRLIGCPLRCARELPAAWTAAAECWVTAD